MQTFIFYVGSLLSCSPDVKCTLFKSFCSNMYCSTMWYNGTVTAMRKYRIAYNNSLRRLLGIHILKHLIIIILRINTIFICILI